MADTMQTAGDAPAITSSQWSIVKVELQNDPSAFNRLQIPCTLCNGIISTDPFDHDTPGVCPGMDILPCGHIMGHKCRVNLWYNGVTSCPICQESLAHAGCKHPVTGRPLRSYEDIHNFPLTIPEGDKVEENCALCEIHLNLTTLPDDLPHLVGGLGQRLAAGNNLCLRLETSEGRIRNIWYEYPGTDHSPAAEDYRRTSDPEYVIILEPSAQIKVGNAAVDALAARSGSWDPASVSVRVGIEGSMSYDVLAAAGFEVEPMVSASFLPSS